MENNIQNNIQQAKAEIETLLVKYNVALVPTVVHQGDRTFSRIDVVDTSSSEQSLKEDNLPEAFDGPNG